MPLYPAAASSPRLLILKVTEYLPVFVSVDLFIAVGFIEVIKVVIDVVLLHGECLYF